MNALGVLRATTKGVDIAWAVSIAAIAALAALASTADGSSQHSDGVAPSVAMITGFMLAFRYQFAGAPAAMFWFDAARQAVPGVTTAALQAEAIRLVLFLLCLLLPMAAVGVALDGLPALAWLPAAAGIAIAAVGLGVLTAVMPYRWFAPLTLATLAFFASVQAGWLPTTGPTALLVGLTILALCAVLVAIQLRHLLRRGVDPAVGGDYTFMFSLGRHHGSAFTAPHSSPIPVLLNERRERRGATAVPTPLDARVRGLLGEDAWRLSTTPTRSALQWLVLIALYPLLMACLFAWMHHQHGDNQPLAGRAPMLLLVLTVLWGMMMTAAMQAQYLRGLRAGRTGGDGLDAELQLLPGVATSKPVWARRLRPLWLPQSLAMGVIAVGLAATFGASWIGVVALALLAGMEATRMRMAMWAALERNQPASRVLSVVGAANGLVLVLVLPVWVYGIMPSVDQAMTRDLASIGVPLSRLLLVLLLPALLLFLAAHGLRGAHRSGLVREVAG